MRQIRLQFNVIARRYIQLTHLSVAAGLAVMQTPWRTVVREDSAVLTRFPTYGQGVWSPSVSDAPGTPS